MKLYTLTYDCNTPTKQQINVPTNTDYKIGIKVRRNGEIQTLSPESVKLYTGEEVEVQPDAVKTNGYVTFTLSASDNASYTSEKLDIQKGYDFDNTVWYAAGPAQSGDRANFLSAESSAEKLGLAGFEMTVDDIQWGWKTDGTANLNPVDIAEWYTSQTYIGATKSFFNWPNGRSALAYQAHHPNALAWFSEDGTQAEWREKVTIDPRWILVTGATGTGYKTNVGKYWVVAYKFRLGTPWSAKFDLNTNIFKSQQGDIADGVEDASTAKLVGKFADGTDFDYDIVVV